MSKSIAKSDRRSGKMARKSAKKGAKSAQLVAKKTTKTAARRNVGKNASRIAAIRAPVMSAKALPKILRTSSPPVQPAVAEGITIKTHKYQIGETVYFTSPTFGRAAATGSYTVVKLLPSEGDDYQYRIKSSGEAFERVAKESQLDRA